MHQSARGHIIFASFRKWGFFSHVDLNKRKSNCPCMIAKVALMGMFGTVVVVVVIFQITFHAEIHADDFFIF